MNGLVSQARAREEKSPGVTAMLDPVSVTVMRRGRDLFSSKEI